jgi:hypothetical protein
MTFGTWRLKIDKTLVKKYFAVMKEKQFKFIHQIYHSENMPGACSLKYES